jgi:hypothetical protein
MKEAPRDRVVWPILFLSLHIASCKPKETQSTISPQESSKPPLSLATPKVSSDPTDDVCLFFTKEIAKEGLGTEVEGPTHVSLTHVEHQRDDCQWHAAGKPNIRLTGTVSKHSYARDQFVSDMKSSFPEAQELSGIGEAALLMGKGATRQAVAFTPKYTVNVLGSAEDAKLKTALIQFIARLPE